jgi:hypothetical protein
MKKILFTSAIVSMGIIFICIAYAEKFQKIENPDTRIMKEEIDSKVALRPDINFGKIPLYFISNKGQVNQQAKFYAKTSRYTLWLTKRGLVFDSTKRSEVRGQRSEKPFQRQYQRDVSRLMFIGSNKNPEIIPLNETKLKVNYFKGNDPSKWVGDIPTSQAVLYKNLYKNIDLKVYGIEKQIEYDWIVKPGGNPEDIKFEYKNVKKTKIDKKGNLVITTTFGELIHKRPVSYQKVHVGADLRVCPSGIQNEKRITVQAAFKKIKKNNYGFEVGEYDKRIDLIIDPIILVYSTYLGGNDTDYCFGIDVDNSGFAHITGHTYSTDFPILNQGQTNKPGGDIFVTKIDTTQGGLPSLIYSTYMGGAENDFGNGIAVDSNGYTYVTGNTHSTNFPTRNQYQTDQPGLDVIVAKLDTSQSGTGSLIYSTYLGGGNTDYGWGIDVDNNGYAYVTGDTKSSDFPTINQYQTDQPGRDVFVTKLDPAQSGTASLLYSTYLGGGDDDYGYGIAADNSSHAYVTGETHSTDFPTLNQYQSDPADGECDAYVTKLDTSQSGTASLIYSTYLGGGNTDYGWDVDVDNNGYAYVIGDTWSSDFPTINQYQTDQPSRDVFVTKLDPAQSGTASLLYSTYLGGGDEDWGFGITVDNNGHAYVTGFTFSTDFPLFYQYQSDPGDANCDAFVTKVDTFKNGSSSLLGSTYLGGGDADKGMEIAVDSSGNVYVAGYTNSTDFPILNQYQSDQPERDAFVTKLLVPALEVISPNGGEDWTLNTTQSITWEAEGLSNNILIILLQNEVKVALIAQNINPTLESYEWNVGDCVQGTVVANDNCKILIREESSAVKDQSDADFTISDPYLKVTSPNGGEVWAMNSTQDITWDAGGLSGTLYIVLQQKGVNVALIQKNIDVSLGTYSWTVGDCRIGSVTAGSNYKIVLKHKDSKVKDRSDGSFNIIIF